MLALSSAFPIAAAKAIREKNGTATRLGVYISHTRNASQIEHQPNRKCWWSHSRITYSVHPVYDKMSLVLVEQKKSRKCLNKFLRSSCVSGIWRRRDKDQQGARYLPRGQLLTRVFQQEKEAEQSLRVISWSPCLCSSCKVTKTVSHLQTNPTYLSQMLLEQNRYQTAFITLPLFHWGHPQYLSAIWCNPICKYL